MGNAAALPERIDADTARALVGSDRLFQSLLPRAPWAVQKFRRGETISRSEARLIWERETYEGAARASSDKVQEHLLPSKQRYDTSEFDGDAKRAVAALERRLFDALTELKGLRPLRREAAELPILRGKLRRATEDVENVSRTCEQLERRLAAAKCELDGYKRHEGQAVDALKRRSVKLERKLADALEERDIARREADELRKDADASRAELRETLAKTQQRQLDPEALAATGPSRRRSPSPRRSRSPSPAKEPMSKTGPQRVEREASPARSEASAAKKRDASPEREPESPKREASPAPREDSPAKRDASPAKRDASPEREASPAKRDASPEREASLETEPAKKPGGAFAVGAKCEARYKGKKRFYPGRVDADNGDGTYVIKYDDDEVESNVAEELIRLVEEEKASTPPAGDGKYAIGTKIEAR